MFVFFDTLLSMHAGPLTLYSWYGLQVDMSVFFDRLLPMHAGPLTPVRLLA